MQKLSKFENLLIILLNRLGLIITLNYKVLLNKSKLLSNKGKYLTMSKRKLL